MCTPWKHSASRYCLLLQRADHLLSPTVSFWEQHLRKEIVQLAEAFLANPYDRRLWYSAIPARHPVLSEDRGRIYQLQQEENQTHCQPFSAQIYVIAFRQKHIWAFFGPSSEYFLSVYIQLSAPCYF